VRLSWTTSFHTYIARSEVDLHNLFSHMFFQSEVVVLLPLFTPMLTGVRELSFVVVASV
jgi:hypothetical protein